MTIDIRVLGKDDDTILRRVAPGVFDHDIDERLTREFLHDPRHHIAVAIEEGVVVGFASAVHYIHPDKPAELWINEVAVASTHQNQGIGKRLLQAILEVGRKYGCGEAWVLTDRTNLPAMRMYTSVGGIEDPHDSVMFTYYLDR